MMLAALPDSERRAALRRMSAAELSALEWCWPVWARPDQLPPEGAWRIWLMLAGRGSGKTRASAETVRAEVEAGRRRSIGLISPTADTGRRDQVATLLSIGPPHMRPTHEPSQRRLVWPNGALGYVLSSEEPDRIRGLNLDWVWGDELTSWAGGGAEAWSNLQLALRVSGPKGHAPAGVVSTTPKPHKLLKAILTDPATVTTRSSTYANRAHLDSAALAALERQYAGSRLGRQELGGELLEDVEGALWNRDMLDACRVPADEARVFKRVVVAIDPSGGGGAETGIVVAGLGQDGHGYILRDLSGRFTPERWAHAAVTAYQDHRADRIVAERNYGGAMVEGTIRATAPNVPVRLVNATRGKAVRAEPVVALFEQRRVHLAGLHSALEDQLCEWDPMGHEPSPDRLDAMVWAITDLMLGEAAPKPMRWAYLPHMER